MAAHFENGAKCVGSKIWASVHTIPAQFASDVPFSCEREAYPSHFSPFSRCADIV